MVSNKKEEVEIEDTPIVEETVKVETTKVDSIKEDTITIKKSELTELMDRLKRVEAVAEKSRLTNYDEKNKKDENRKIKIRTIDGKVILSWDSMDESENIVEKNPNGVFQEYQIVTVHYEDGTQEKIPYMYFSRRWVILWAELVSKSVINQGSDNEETILALKAEDGKEYSINKKFVN